jgi:hypothetical protein
MPILRISVLTCVIYILLALLLELGTTLAARFFGGLIIGGRPWGIALIFAIVWLVSYSVAWHLLRLPPIMR